MKKEDIEKKLRKWSKNSNMSYEEILSIFSENLNTFKEIFPGLDNEILLKKALLKTKTNIKTKLLGFPGMTEEYVFFCIGMSDITDPLVNLRNQQLEKYREYLKEGFEEKAIKERIVKKVGESIIPLYPKTRRDGQPSKMAGQPIPQPPESLSQLIIGIGRSVNDNELHGVILNLRGQATNEKIELYKSYKVSAVNVPKDSKVLNLSTKQNKPIENNSFEYEFNNAEDLKKYFSPNIVNLDSIKKWTKSGRIPDNYQQLTIVDNVICSFPSDLTVSARGNTIVNFDSNDLDLEEENPFLLRGVLRENMIKYIDFPEMTEVMAIGQPWLVQAKDEEGNDITDCIFKLLNVVPIEKTEKIKVNKITENMLKVEDIW
ncbi:MAG: hypothetical protein ACTSXD_13470 [Candidatus Heimdallarchaeaceae archaeon]